MHNIHSAFFNAVFYTSAYNNNIESFYIKPEVSLQGKNAALFWKDIPVKILSKWCLLSLPAPPVVFSEGWGKTSIFILFRILYLFSNLTRVSRLISYKAVVILLCQQWMLQAAKSRQVGKEEVFVYPNVFLIMVLTKIKKNQGSTK